MKALIRFCWVCSALLCFDAALAAEQGNLRFLRAGTNEFTFNTGVIRGKLRANGKSAGLSSVFHVQTGVRLDASMGLFSHYRLFTANRRYGAAAWDLPSEATLEPDGSVAVRWPASEDRPFELGAIYRWTASDTLDLTTTVLAKSDLHNFESFLASYFSSGFTNAAVCVQRERQKSFLQAERALGVWLAFPRDDEAISIIQDGRWKLEPNPVDWIINSKLGGALAYRCDTVNRLTAIIMAPRADAFAVLTPYETEPHYSTYLSLFGRDFKAGESARVRSRMIIGQLLADPEILSRYSAYSNP